VTPAGEFAAFVGSVPRREVRLPSGRSEVWDVGEGPPVLLLHGIAASRRLFFRLVPLLARSHRVVVPLLRGEDRGLRRIALEELLDDVAALLSSLELRKARLLGISFGGYLALAYGARNDPRVGQVVSQGGFARFPLRFPDRVAAALGPILPAEVGSAYFAWRTLRGRETRFLEEREKGLGTLNAAWCRKTPFPTLLARVRLMSREGIEPRLARIAVPVSLAHGAADSVVPAALFDRLRAAMPASRAVSFEGLGHTLCLSHPELLRDLLLGG
jgi:pimeloyl-ACP methyl ester carboxylesterase